MAIPWNLIIAAAILAFALLIKHFFAETLEEEQPFVYLVIAFLIAYIVGALAMSFLDPMTKIAPLFAAQQNTVQTGGVMEPTVKL